MTAAEGITAIVLAGARDGQLDPLALAAGTTHKALVQVAGVAMLSHVLGTLQACRQIGRIVVCAQNAAGLVDGLDGAGGVMTCDAESSPSLSVGAMLTRFGTPLLITTADHPLLTPAMVSHLLAARTPGVDVMAAVARSSVIRAAFPETKRTWLRFRDGAFSGCNLFLLCTPGAANAVRFWERLEQDRKRPLALARLLGLRALITYALGLATLDRMLAILSAHTGQRLAVVEMPFAEAAVDVDKPEDLALVEAIFARRCAA